MSPHGSLFQLIKSNALVFGQQNPTMLANKRQPVRILGSRREVLTVAFVLYTVLQKNVDDWFAVVKILVEVQNEVFRQRQLPLSAPSGLLLRSALA